jgi:hypothetical protein
LNDGVHPTVTFEFDSNGSVSLGRVGINVSAPTDGGVGDATQVAQDIVAAVASVGANLGITATLSGVPGVVSLVNTAIGGYGNQPVVSTVTDPGFHVTGMSGGAGSDCPAGVGCVTSDDCRPGLTCQGAAAKTCL